MTKIFSDQIPVVQDSTTKEWFIRWDGLPQYTVPEYAHLEAHQGHRSEFGAKLWVFHYCIRNIQDQLGALVVERQCPPIKDEKDLELWSARRRIAKGLKEEYKKKHPYKKVRKATPPPPVYRTWEDRKGAYDHKRFDYLYFK